VDISETRYAQSGDVNIAYRVAGSGIVFEDRGAAELKGVSGEWRLYAVADAAS
jgi:hypothetical protein